LFQKANQEVVLQAAEYFVRLFYKRAARSAMQNEYEGFGIVLSFDVDILFDPVDDKYFACINRPLCLSR
jgi:hypothetical protein